MGDMTDERRLIQETAHVFAAPSLAQYSSGNTNAPTIMIGGKGAAMIKEDARP